MNSKRPSIVQCQDVFSEIYKQISREENLLLSPKGNIEVRIFNNLQNKPSLLFKQALSSSFFGCQISPTELQQKQKAKKVLKKISKQLQHKKISHSNKSQFWQEFNKSLQERDDSIIFLRKKRKNIIKNCEFSAIYGTFNCQIPSNQVTDDLNF